MSVHTDAFASMPTAQGVPRAPAPVPPSANQARYAEAAQDDRDTDAPASGFGAGDEMNVAVRMVIPLRREFGRMLDVSHFLHDAHYARGIIDLARSSRDARLRGYAAFLEVQMGLQVLLPTAAPAPLPTHSAAVAVVPAEVAAVSQAAASRSIDFAEVKRRSARQVLGLLGPTAEALCLRIEKAGTLDEYVVAARRAHGVVRDIRGAARAAEIGDLVESLLEQLQRAARSG